MDVSSRLLAQFVVVAEEQHLGRAAARLSISQPPPEVLLLGDDDELGQKP